MDKIKIKTAITDLKSFLDELVTDGLLDGDQKIEILFKFSQDKIIKEIEKDLTPPE